MGHHPIADHDVPVLFVALVNKGQRAGLGQVERNAMRQGLPRLADAYREGVRSKLRTMRPERSSILAALLS
jgi:hypothetical protein